jgi:hypothetical protein
VFREAGHIDVRCPSPPIEGTTTAYSYLTRHTLHEEHRHIFSTVLATSRAVDETPSFVIATEVVKPRHHNVRCDCFSDSVSVFILTGRWRLCTLILILIIIRNLVPVLTDEGIDSRDYLAYWQIIADLEHTLNVRVVDDLLTQAFIHQGVVFALTGVPASAALVAEVVPAKTTVEILSA